MKRIITIATLCLLMAVYKAEAIDLSSWAYKSTITFSGYGKTETLTNFPALVQIGTNISGYSPSQSLCPVTNGCDLRFTAADGTTELNYEKELWSNSTLTNSIFWVQVPLLTNGTQIVAYWGKSTNSPAYTTNGATWSNGYVAVWHMNQTNAMDSTINANTGVSTGNTNAPGFVGLAQGFRDGAYLDMGNKSSLNPTAISISSWVQFSSLTPAYSMVYSKISNASSSYHQLAVKSNGKIACYVYANSSIYYDGTGAYTLSLGNWYYLTLVYGPLGGLRGYVNGLQDGTTSSATLLSGNSVVNAFIGRDSYTAGRFPNGLYDEVRVSNVERSSNWVWACYQNMASNTVFQGYGTATAQSSGNPAAMFQAIMSLLE